MDGLKSIINTPFGYALRFFANLFGGNFAVSVLLFTLLINIILIPLSIKSQKSSVQQLRIKPKLDDLKKRYGDDKQKYSAEMQKLYQEEGVSMSGGCLPMVLRLVIMLCIYWLIMQPLTYMVRVDKTNLETVTKGLSASMTAIEKEDKDHYDELVKKLEWSSFKGYPEMALTRVVRDHGDTVGEIVTQKRLDTIKKKDGKITLKQFNKAYASVSDKYGKANLDFKLFGIDLLTIPGKFFAMFTDWSNRYLIPIFAFLAQILTSVISMLINKKNNPDAPTMAGMLLTMPLISLFIGFNLPCGVGFYWICSSLAGGLIQSGVQWFYGPQKMLAKERVKELSKRCDFEEKQLQKLNGSSEN